MITRKVIQTLYRKYRNQPESPDCLDMALLFDAAGPHHNISVDMEGPVDSLVIGSIAPESPFHKLPLERIHAIVPFEEWVGIVMHSSVVFLNRNSAKVSVNVRMEEQSLFDRVCGFFQRR